MRVESFVCQTLLTGALAVMVSACASSSLHKDAAERMLLPMTVVARAEQERAAPSAFAAALTDEQAAVRARAVIALARLEHTTTLPLLLLAMDDVDAGVRRAAAFALGQLDLALEPSSADHEGVRSQAEARLVRALDSESDEDVHRAVVRALGRVANRTGIDALVVFSTTSSALRAEAFTALGVSGARRKASRSNDAALTSSVAAALSNGADDVRAAAAYAAFRQKLKVPLEALRAGVSSKDAQVRIFLMRAIASQDDASAQLLLSAGLKDADWRVQSEALRAASSRPQSATLVSAVIDGAVPRLARASAADFALGHVVREACTALVGMGAGPAEAQPALQRALLTLAPLVQHRSAACACAVALEVIDPTSKAIKQCQQAPEQTSLDVLRVRLASSSRVPSEERVARLLQLYASQSVKVRMAVGGALVEIGSPAAAAAASVLFDEEDYGVATTLLELLSAEESNDLGELLPDSTMYRMLERFRAGSTVPGGPYEKVEPLVTVAKIARSRQTSTSLAIVEELKSHGEPRVRDAAAGVLPGDRAQGPRASIVPAPPVAELPLYAKLKTTRGDIRIAFDREHAPSTVANFVALARAKFYDGTVFHRVIADFVAQGGDPRGDGAGGPGYTIACENSDEPFTRGAVGMATAGKDTGGSQFFFTHSHQPHLDGRYTLFARVIEGLLVMDALQPDDVLLSVDFLGAAPAIFAR